MDLSSVAQSQVAPTSTFSYTFNFKTIPEAKLPELEKGLDNPLPKEEFEFSVHPTRGNVCKRKSITATLSLPPFAAGLPELAQAIIQSYVADYVKSQYIDSFAPIGEHSWEVIEKAAAASGRRGAVKLDISEETWAEAAASFGAYVLAAIGNKVASERMAEMMKAKFSKNAINKQASEFSENICSKLLAHVNAWGEWAAENEENAEDYENVFTFITDRLTKHIAVIQEADVNLTDLL